MTPMERFLAALEARDRAREDYVYSDPERANSDMKFNEFSIACHEYNKAFAAWPGASAWLKARAELDK